MNIDSTSYMQLKYLRVGINICSEGPMFFLEDLVNQTCQLPQPIPKRLPRFFSPFALSVHKGTLKQRLGLLSHLDRAHHSFFWGSFLSPSTNFIITFSTFSHPA
jgi:hypothetical protein